MLTEEEAKTKWCPLARYDDNINRDGTNDAEFSPCIASACMAWRASTSFDNDAIILEHSVPEWEANGWKVLERLEGGNVQLAHPRKGSGFCGAFGRPA